MSENTFKYKVEKINDKSIAVIYLTKNVLGGNDGFEFNSMVEKLKIDNQIVCVDLNEVEVINSSGLGMLISGHTSLKNSDVKFALINVPDKVHNLLKVTHLDQVLKSFKSLNEL